MRSEPRDISATPLGLSRPANKLADCSAGAKRDGDRAIFGLGLDASEADMGDDAAAARNNPELRQSKTFSTAASG